MIISFWWEQCQQGLANFLPMLVVALLLPPGESPVDKAAFLKCHTHIKNYGCFAGSTTILIPPLSVIERQLSEDCHKYGIKVLVGSQVRTVQILLKGLSKAATEQLPIHCNFLKRCAISIDGPLHSCCQRNLRRLWMRESPKSLSAVWSSFQKERWPLMMFFWYVYRPMVKDWMLT